MFQITTQAGLCAIFRGRVRDAARVLTSGIPGPAHGFGSTGFWQAERPLESGSPSKPGSCAGLRKALEPITTQLEINDTGPA